MGSRWIGWSTSPQTSTKDAPTQADVGGAPRSRPRASPLFRRGVQSQKRFAAFPERPGEITIVRLRVDLPCRWNLVVLVVLAGLPRHAWRALSSPNPSVVLVFLDKPPALFASTSMRGYAARSSLASRRTWARSVKSARWYFHSTLRGGGVFLLAEPACPEAHSWPDSRSGRRGSTWMPVSAHALTAAHRHRRASGMVAKRNRFPT